MSFFASKKPAAETTPSEKAAETPAPATTGTLSGFIAKLTKPAAPAPAVTAEEKKKEEHDKKEHDKKEHDKHEHEHDKKPPAVPEKTAAAPTDNKSLNRFSSIFGRKATPAGGDAKPADAKPAEHHAEHAAKPAEHAKEGEAAAASTAPSSFGVKSLTRLVSLRRSADEPKVDHSAHPEHVAAKEKLTIAEQAHEAATKAFEETKVKLREARAELKTVETGLIAAAKKAVKAVETKVEEVEGKDKPAEAHPAEHAAPTHS